MPLPMKTGDCGPRPSTARTFVGIGRFPVPARTADDDRVCKSAFDQISRLRLRWPRCERSGMFHIDVLAKIFTSLRAEHHAVAQKSCAMPWISPWSATRAPQRTFTRNGAFAPAACAIARRCAPSFRSTLIPAEDPCIAHCGQARSSVRRHTPAHDPDKRNVAEVFHHQTLQSASGNEFPIG